MITGVSKMLAMIDQLISVDARVVWVVDRNTKAQGTHGTIADSGRCWTFFAHP